MSLIYPIGNLGVGSGRRADVKDGEFGIAVSILMADIIGTGNGGDMENPLDLLQATRPATHVSMALISTRRTGT